MTQSQFRKLARILFSLGRIPRSTFWVVSVILYPFLYLMGMVIRIFDKNHSFPWVGLAFLPVAVYLIFALYIERLHDRDKNGWWSLFMLVPIVNLWFLIEMLFFRGTHGPNRFGPDPLATGTITTDVAAGEHSARVLVEAKTAAPVERAQSMRPAGLLETMRLKKDVLAIAGVLIIVGLGTFSVAFHKFLHGLEGYCNVRLTDDKKEVLYRLGYPPWVLGGVANQFGDHPLLSTDAKVHPKGAMPPDKGIDDFNEWSYNLAPKGEGNASLYVAFDPLTNKVSSVSCVDTSDAASSSCPPLVGVEFGESEGRVYQQLGEPNRSKLDGTSKTIRYDDLGVEFVLTREKIYYLTLRKDRADALSILGRYLRTLLP